MARINDMGGSSHATRLSQTFPLTLEDHTLGELVVQWGSMLQDPADHTAGQAPFFRIEVLAAGVAIPSGSYSANARQASAIGSGWVKAGSADGASYWYRKGRFRLDVTNYPVGTLITVSVIAADCSLFGHGGMAYLDDVHFEARSACTPPPRDMIGWWPLDEVSGTTARDYTQGHNGTHPSGMTRVAGHGSLGKALVFDQNSYFAVPDPLDNGLDIPAASGNDKGDFSIDAWIKPAATVGYQYLVQKRGLTVGIGCLHTRGFDFYLRDNRLACALLDETACNLVRFESEALTALTPGQWHHVVVTVDRDEPSAGIKFYCDSERVDGGNLDPTPVSGSLANDWGLSIGMNATSPRGGEDLDLAHFAGAIDEVEIFDRVLTSSEIGSIYSAAEGKCKEWCFVDASKRFCDGDNSVTARVTVFNESDVTQDYLLAATALPVGSLGGGMASNIPGPGAFTFLSTPAFSIGPGASHEVDLRVDRPGQMIAYGNVMAYEVVATNTSTEARFVCSGNVVDGRLWCLGEPWPHGRRVGVGSPFDVALVVPGSGQIGNLHYRIHVFALQHEVNSALALNGLLPGADMIDSVSLVPGVPTTVRVQGEFIKHEPFSSYSIGLFADVDGDSIPDELGSADVQSIAPAGAVRQVPVASRASMVIMIGTLCLASGVALRSRGRLSLGGGSPEHAPPRVK